jgi:hypothetical protein
VKRGRDQTAKKAIATTPIIAPKAIPILISPSILPLPLLAAALELAAAALSVDEAPAAAVPEPDAWATAEDVPEAAAALLADPLAAAPPHAVPFKREAKEGSWTGGEAEVQNPWAVFWVAFWSATEQFASTQGAIVQRKAVAVQ